MTRTLSPGNKVISTSATKVLNVPGRSSAGDNRGSSRSYPKGRAAAPNVASWNPMNTKASTYGLDGV